MADDDLKVYWTAMRTITIRKKTLNWFSFFLLVIFVNGCAQWNILSDRDIDQAFLLPIKFQKQEPDKCGITALSAVLEYLQIDYSGIEKIYSPKEKGTRLITLVNYANQYTHAEVHRIGYEEVVKHILNRRPIIIMRKVEDGYHYYVVKGFVVNDRKIVVNDGYHENVLLRVGDDGASSDIAVIFG